jgi:hypothetical protein
MAESEFDAPTIVVEGRACRPARLRLGDYRELEQRFAASRPDPLSCAREQLRDLSELLQRQLLEMAFEASLRPTSPTVDELRRWLLSIDGLSAALELGLREVVPSVSAESCRRAVYAAEGARREELLRTVEFVVGLRLRDEGDVGNGRGRSAAVSASATEETAAELEGIGEPDWIGQLCATD